MRKKYSRRAKKKIFFRSCGQRMLRILCPSTILFSNLPLRGQGFVEYPLFQNNPDTNKHNYQSDKYNNCESNEESNCESDEESDKESDEESDCESDEESNCESN